jgi:hypothetical protein
MGNGGLVWNYQALYLISAAIAKVLEIELKEIFDFE